jgi:hypothetical protein
LAVLSRQRLDHLGGVLACKGNAGSAILYSCDGIQCSAVTPVSLGTLLATLACETRVVARRATRPAPSVRQPAERTRG